MFNLVRSMLGSYSRRPEPSIDQPPEYFPGDADRPEIQAGLTRKDFEFWRVDASGRQWFRRKRQPKADTRSVIRGVES